jgi:endo-1,4-beta-D-glucanase Y
MKNRVILVAFFFLSVFCLFGQSRPFPQNVDYPYGYQAAGISADTVRAMYERWKSEYIRECNGMYRVRCTDDTSETRSEGMGYGMLLSAYFGDKGVFDSLFAFYKSKRTSQAYNLMAWQVTCGGITDQGSATDGDLDVAFALLVADDQWWGDYLEEADSILSILKEHYFVTCGSDIYTMKPGGWFGGCNLTDISYYTPAYFEAFGDQTGDPFWYDVIDGAYIILDNGTNSSTGLVRDWQTWDGSAVSGWDSTYSYDACRVPWRMALDYIWNGNADAEFWCSDISDFANSIGASSIVDGYYLDGTPSGSNNSSSFVGGFAVGAMCHSQEMVDDFTSHLLSRDGRPGEDRYFNFSLRCLYMLVLTGNFWQPDPNSSFIESNPLPEKFYLKQNYPNPFSAMAIIDYSIAEAGFVKLSIYDITGREIKILVEESMPAGKHTVNVELKGLSSGVYICRLETGGMSIQKKMILLK